MQKHGINLSWNVNKSCIWVILKLKPTETKKFPLINAITVLIKKQPTQFSIKILLALNNLLI